jgi:hypothetical protein
MWQKALAIIEYLLRARHFSRHFFGFVVFVFFWDGVHYAARLALNLRSSCLSLLSAGLQVCATMPDFSDFRYYNT